MALIKNIKYSYNDVSTVPAEITEIQHRSECNCFNSNGMLPLFTAPMASVVDENNFQTFQDNKINAILPRTVDINIRKEYAFDNKWAAFGLEEFNQVFLQNIMIDERPIKALIDVANGHMKKILDYAKLFKHIYPNATLMAGNIANPNTIVEYDEAGIDLVRLGIGGGLGCITTSNVSVHYSIASLIDETKEIKNNLRLNIKLVADGGVRNYSDAIKALALGADYVMIGGVFTKMLESAAPIFKMDFPNPERKYVKLDEIDKDNKQPLYKSFFGMASKKAQIMMHGEKVHTSEGIEKIVQVEYTMKQWVDNFADYLRSAMSYTNHRELQDFIDYTDTIIISENTYNSLNK